MDAGIKTVVTFRSSAFNISEPRDYFINPGCFGDDVARWLMEELRSKGHEATSDAKQEDFGWYFTFLASGVEHCFVIGHRPGGANQEGLWIGWLERSRGFLPSLVGARKTGILPVSIELIEGILSGSSQIKDMRWHFARDVHASRGELLGT